MTIISEYLLSVEAIWPANNKAASHRQPFDGVSSSRRAIKYLLLRHPVPATNSGSSSSSSRATTATRQIERALNMWQQLPNLINAAA